MTLTEWLPFVETARGYKRDFLRGDLVASLTVAMMVVPQSIAYALIAGLPPVYGLYSSILVAIVGALLGSSEHLVCGPTNSIAIVIASALMTSSLPMVRLNPVAAVGLLALLVGGTQLLFGLLKVGNLAQFVSRSVIVGFTAGAGLLIATNQLAPFLGVEIPATDHMLELVWQTVLRAGDANLHAVALGLGTMVITCFGDRWRPRWPWELAAVVAAAAAVFLFDLEKQGVRLVGGMAASLPSFELPGFDLRVIADMADDALAIAILGCIETMSIAKSIAISSGQRLDTNQGFIGIGAANLVGALFQCMPGSGSFTRSAMNFQAGARTRFAGVMSGLWVAVIVLLFGRLARYIPAASLAGLLIVLGLRMVHLHQIRVAMRATRSDATVLALTFACALLLHLRMAIYVGVISSLVLFLRKASAPHLVEYDLDGDTMREIRDPGERSHPQISIIHVEGELFFGAAELFEDEVRRLASDPNIRVVVLRMKNARHLDATSVMALEALHKFMREDNRLLLVSGATADVMRVLRNSGLLAQVGEDCVFPAEENLTAATRKALARAQEFLGKEAKPEVRVFYEKTRAEQQPPA